MRERLQDAALDLFQRDGYEATTAARIAARVGVTERTFFRHFTDKREILFGAEDLVRDALVAGIRDAPQGLGPLDMIFVAYEALRPVMEEQRGYARQRQQLISATPALKERELTKIDALARSAADALRERGVAPTHAVLAGHVGMAAIAQATAEWLEVDGIGLAEQFRLARKALGALI